MNRFGDSGGHPWRITIVAVGGLLAAIIVVGVVGLLVNRNIQSAADEVLRYDVEIEDDGDDLRAAALEIRHYQRDAYFGGPSRARTKDFEGAYEALLREIEEFEDPGVGGRIREHDVARPDQLRAMAEEYHAGFQSAMDEYRRTGEKAGFDEANDLGLRRIAELERASAQIDELGEKLTEDSVERVDRAATSATVVLLTVIGGLLLFGVVLAYAAVRVVSDLRAASEAKTDFLADASHELRTPLTVLRGNAQIGLSLDGSPDQKEILDDIVKESGRMKRMVEDLLFLARSDSASVPLRTEPVPVPGFLAELAERAKALARERGAGLETELSGEGAVALDQDRAEQAILILVDNAAKYGPPGGKLRLSSETRSGELRLTVTDEGPGIPHEELPLVFERFYRVDKTRARKLGGSGLGLPIAKTITKAHGGRIEAHSRAGEGTRMTVRIPLITGTDGKRSEGTSSEAPARRRY